ncbi:MAG: hypothetical protein WKF47_02155 [Geodermatophilaceae bacterium]
MHGNLYEVDPALAGARVELTFDPFDLTDIAVRHHGRTAGAATPFQIGRHVHPKARTDTAPADTATPTGIDYLRLVEDRHTRSLGERLHYAQLADPAQSTDPASGSASPAPDAELDAELASFAALRRADSTGPATPDNAAPDNAAPDNAAPDNAAPDNAAPDIDPEETR